MGYSIKIFVDVYDDISGIRRIGISLKYANESLYIDLSYNSQLDYMRGSLK